MATYYVRRTGSDSNNGTSPSTAWFSLSKALGASGIGSGDTVYVGAGVYREVVTVSTPTLSAETKVLADTDGSQTGDAGEVRWTNYIGSDSSAPLANPILSLNQRNNLTFDGFTFTAGSAGTVIPFFYGSCVQAFYGAGVGSTGITFRNCLFYDFMTASVPIMYISAKVNATTTWSFDRCQFVKTGSGNVFFFDVNDTGSTADYNTNYSFSNCVFQHFCSDSTLFYFKNGSGGHLGGGLGVLNCTWYGGGYFLELRGGSPTYPHWFYNNLLVGSNILYTIYPNTVVEDFNIVVTGQTQPTGSSLTSGGNSLWGSTSPSHPAPAPLVHFGQEYLTGKLLRFPYTPTADSPLRSFGHAVITPSHPPTSYDLLNRPRAAGLETIGAIERHDTGVPSGGPSSPGGLAIVGKGDHDLFVPVAPGGSTISLQVGYDSGYSGQMPQVILLPNALIGVSGQTLDYVDSGHDGALHTLTFTTLNATAHSWVVLRCLSRTSSGGRALFSFLSVS